MEHKLKELLWAFLANNNPDLMIGLQQRRSVSGYLEDKVSAVLPMADELERDGSPPYVVLDLCFAALTEELKPSRFNYIRSILEDDFPGVFMTLKECGILTCEITNMIAACSTVFEHFGFSPENEEDRHLRYAVIAELADYLKDLWK